MSKGILSQARQAYAKTGKPIPVQLYEMAQLALGPGRITPREYFFFRLYDDDLFDDKSEKSRFIGKAAEYPVSRFVNNTDWYAVSADKLVAQMVFQSLGLPVPGIKAIFHRYRTAGNVRALRNGDDIEAFLRLPNVYPMFAKPITGSHGLGTASLQGYDAQSDEILMPFGKRVRVSDYVNSIRDFPKGFLFLEHLHPHPYLEKICGDRVASCRVIVFLGGAEPEITHVMWKIPAAQSITDHFANPDNLIAPVDKETGEVFPALQGTGLDLVTLDAHPQSGERITGLMLPHWDQVKDLCLTASTAAPGLQLQGWDIALCPEGPVILECNMGGDFCGPQVAFAKGMLTHSLEAALVYRNKAWKRAVLGSIVTRSIAKALPKGAQRKPHAA